MTPTCSVPVCLVAVKIVVKATPAVPFSIRKARGFKDWIYATICELSSSNPASCVGRLTGALQTIDTDQIGYDVFPAETGWTLRDSADTLIAGQSAGSFSTEGGAVSTTAL
jgi:hypothetical protein